MSSGPGPWTLGLQGGGRFNPPLESPIIPAMAPAAAFAEVLDRCLDHAPIRDAAAAGRSTFGVGTRPLFWFEGAAATPAPASGKPAPSVRAASIVHAASPLRLVPSAAHRARPKRTLSAAQCEAFNQLIGLGAALDTDFTMQELRSQFRALAHAYHPDRQAGRAAATLAANAFVTLRSAYDVLKHAA